MRILRTIQAFSIIVAATGVSSTQAQQPARKFEIVEARIADIQAAIIAKEITTTDVVNAYLARIKAYNGVCVNEPQGVLGPVTPIPGVKSINASSVTPWISYGFGFVGTGWVGEYHSPGTVPCGTATSSMGQMGSPVSRSSTNSSPCFVA